MATNILAQIGATSFFVAAGAKRRSQQKRYSGKLEIAPKNKKSERIGGFESWNVDDERNKGG